MTEIFNNAYNQANQILDGSGLSSVIHKQEGGSFNTYDRALEAWKKDATRGNVMPPIIHRGVAGRIATDTWNRIPNYIKQYGKGIVNKLLYETTGKKLSDTTREDLTKEEVDPMEVAIAKAIVTGTGEFKGLGPTHEDAEALVGGATVSWNPKTGKYGFSDPYDFKDYNKTLPELLQGKAFPDKSYLRALFTGLGHYLVGESKDGVPYPGAMKTRIEIPPQRLQDISEKHDFFGVEDRNLSGLEGYSEETSPSGVTTSFVDDAAIDTIAAFKHGGKITSGGLAGIKKSININGQPHKLAWINSDEASALKAMGGSGKAGPMGIPSYEVDESDKANPSLGFSADTTDYGYYGVSDADMTAAYHEADKGYDDFPPPTADEWASAVAAEESESKEFYKETAKDLIKLAGKAGSGWNEEDVNDYIAQVRVFAKNKYNKDPLMKSDVDREAARVLDRLAVEYDLPLYGIGMRYRDDLGANEPLHYWQMYGYTNKDGIKIPGAIDLSRRGEYGGKDSGVLPVLASIFGHTLIPGVTVIDSLAEKTRKGFGIANPDDPRYWPTPKRSLNNALQAVLNKQRDRIEGIEKGFVASGKELIDMYNLGSDGKVIKDGTNAKPYTPADISNYNYDDFWKSDDPSEELYQGNYEEYPQKLKKLPQVKKDLTEPEEKKEEELTGMAALLAKRPEATSREDSNVYLGELLNQIYGKSLGQSMLG